MAKADAPTVADIERWASDLRSGDDALIAEATERLGHLNADALPSIEARLQRTARQIIPEEDGHDALRYFRHAVGSRRADDTIDIVPGIAEVLKERPSPDVGRAAERLLLLRSLERIGSVPAQRLMGDALALTPAMWSRERQLLLDRMGARLLPGLLWMQAHEQPDVRRWARAAIARLGLNDPGRAVQEEDPERLAGILEAYGATREMNAMTVIISFVGHRDERVRQAARDAMNLFGRNGIWQLREGMRNQLGQEADHEWGWERTSALLYEGLDAQRLGPVTERLERGLQHIEAGELTEARALFDAALVREPMHPRRGELAEHYARFADAVSGAERETLLQRALWLNPNSSQAVTWQQSLRSIEVQRNVAAGFEDVSEALEAAPLASSESPSAGSDSEIVGGPYLGLMAVLCLLGGLVWKRKWVVEKLRPTRANTAKTEALAVPTNAQPVVTKPLVTTPVAEVAKPFVTVAVVAKPIAAALLTPPPIEKAVAQSRRPRAQQTILRWKARLGPLSSRSFALLWNASRRGVAETISLVRTLRRVVSPGSVERDERPRRAKPRPAAAKQSKAAQTQSNAARSNALVSTPTRVPASQLVEAPTQNEGNTIPLAGLFFHNLQAQTPTRNEDEAFDTVDTGLDGLSELPGFFADTSPGTIEAPDTLPG